MNKNWIIFLIFASLILNLTQEQSGSSAKYQTPEDSLCSSFQGPAWSPDGKYIAFNGDCGESLDILVYEIESSRVINLTNTPDKIEFNFDWSPDSQQIAYVKGIEEDRTTDIWIVSVPSGIAENFTIDLGLGDRFYNSFPKWSPDGRYITFNYELDRRWDVAVIDVEKRETTIVTAGYGEGFYMPKWSSDGDYLAFRLEKGLWIASLETGQIEGYLASIRIGNFFWSRTDNSLIVFAPYMEERFISLNIEGIISQYRGMTFSEEMLSHASNPVWSNDGKFMAVEIWGDYGDDLWLVDIENQTNRNITNLPLTREYAATWSPDGTQIAFVSSTESDIYNHHIWIINTDGSGLHNITANIDVP